MQEKVSDTHKAVRFCTSWATREEDVDALIEDLKLVFTGYIEDLRRKNSLRRIGDYITPYNEKNTDESITLEQGINMPFDVVFIDRMDYKHHLAIKNLIGRAGRSTSEYKFDFGYVILNKGANIQKFRNIIINDVELEEVSLLETDDDLGGDYAGFKEAIKNETFSDEYNLTPQEIESLEKPDSEAIVKDILDSTFINDNLISRKQLDDDEFCHLGLYNAFRKLY